MSVSALQLAALAAIGRLQTPSYRDLGVELLVSHQAAKLRVDALERHEPPLVQVTKGRRRGIRITAAGQQLLEQASAPAPELPDGHHREWRNRHVFAHARDAIRCWQANRQGQRVDRARGGRGAGRPPAIEDIARVGVVLASYTGVQLDALVAWAQTGAGGSDQRTKHLIARVTTRLQQLRIVARAVELLPVHRSRWRDAEGQEHETAAFLGQPVDFSCNLDEDHAD